GQVRRAAGADGGRRHGGQELHRLPGGRPGGAAGRRPLRGGAHGPGARGRPTRDGTRVAGPPAVAGAVPASARHARDALTGDRGWPCRALESPGSSGLLTCTGCPTTAGPVATWVSTRTATTAGTRGRCCSSCTARAPRWSGR